MQLSRIYLITIVFLVLGSSCTITKRVHRKGWHVEWHKAHRSSDQTKKQAVELNSIDEIAASLIAESEAIKITTIPKRTAASAAETLIEDNQPVENSQERNPITLQEKESERWQQDEEQTISESQKNHTVSKQGSRTAISGLMLFIIALIAAGLAFLVGLGLYFLAQHIVSTFWLVLTVIGISFFWLLALVYLIAGLIGLFTSRRRPIVKPPANGNEEPVSEEE